MLAKPEGCQGCKWWGDGFGFVPDKIPQGAKVVFLLQNPGKNEEEGRRVVGYEGAKHTVTEPCPPQPLIGPTGYEFHKTFLPLAGVPDEEVGLANCVRCRKQLPEMDPETGRAKRTNDMPDKEEYAAVVAHCTAAHLRIPASVELIVAQGAHAWRLLGGPQPLDDWRGYLHPSPTEIVAPRGDCETNGPIPTFATVHLADLNHRPKMNLPTRKDFLRIGRVLEGTWPRPWPLLLDANTISAEALERWFATAEAAPFVVLDTEYGSETKALTLLGLAIPEEAAPTGHPVLQYHWFAPATYGRRGEFFHLFTMLAAKQTFVFQNVLADMPVIRRHCGLSWDSFNRVEDTMQAHAVLWCEMGHTLEFTASMDSQYNKTKHLMGTDMDRYNAGDLMDTVCCWQARLDEFARDPRSRPVYDLQMRVLPYLDRTMEVGLAVDQEKVPPAIAKYQARVEAGIAMAHTYCGWPINLNSDEQLKAVVYEIEKMPIQKHPESKRPTTNADAVAALRQLFYPVDLKEEETITAATILDRIGRGAHPLLEAHVLHGHADHVLGHYLLPLVKET